MKARRQNAGFTLIEVVIGMSILVVILGAAALAQKTTQGLQENTSQSGLLYEKAQYALEALASELRWAETGSFLVTEDNGRDRIDLLTPTGFAGGETVWSTVITYRIEPSAFDADENGVLDEGRLVRIQDGITRKLCDYVVAGGFTASVVDDNVRLQLNLAKQGATSDALLNVDAQTSITLRN